MIEGEYNNLRIEQTDDDWYRIDVGVGKSLRIDRDSSGGIFQMALRDGACLAPVISNNADTVTATNVSGATVSYFLSIQLFGAPCTAYELRVNIADQYEAFCVGNGGNTPGCTDCPCSNNAVGVAPGGCLNSLGESGFLNPQGFPDIGTPDLSFRARFLTPNSFAVLVSGANRAPANPSNPCFGLDSGITSPAFDGLRCVAGDFKRHGVRPTDANGDVGITNNRWGPPSPPVGGIEGQGGFVAGESRNFQVIYRDSTTVGCGTGLNTTQGIHIVFFP